MKKQIIKGTAAALAAASFMAVGTVGASYLQEISAYLNYGITVKYDGQEQHMYDANGQRVYPISYNGTTYVPIRAVGNMMGIDVAWDGANNTVLLGKTGQAIDFIESFTPYSGDFYDCSHTKINNGKMFTLGNTTYNHYLYFKIFKDMEYSMYYDLGGKYDVFTFDVYADRNSYIRLYGDNGTVLDTIEVTANNLPATHTVSVTGVQQLRISTLWYGSGMWGGNMYIVDAHIE